MKLDPTPTPTKTDNESKRAAKKLRQKEGWAKKNAEKAASDAVLDEGKGKGKAPADNTDPLGT